MKIMPIYSPIRSPLRYPGSKRRLANYIRQTLLMNEFRPELYVEPFAGGASVGLQILQLDLADKVIFMDKDPWIASFWRTVFFDTKWLIEKIKNTKVTLELWQKLKNSKPRSIRDRAWACFYLNRTSFSGILESHSGPLGGREQKSNYKIDCRYTAENLIGRIEEISKYHTKVYAVWNCSWKDGLKKIRIEQKEKKLTKNNIFYYLDPPFFEEADKLYRYYFQDKDHVELRNSLLKMQDKWILSYDYSDQVDILYGDAIKNKTNGTSHHHVDIYYSLAILSERRVAKEVILTNLSKLPTKV